MRTKIVKILFLVLAFVNSTVMLAQKTGPPAPAGNRLPPQAPIDDNIIILLIIGLLFGAYIAYKKNQAKNTAA